MVVVMMKMLSPSCLRWRSVFPPTALVHPRTDWPLSSSTPPLKSSWQLASTNRCPSFRYGRPIICRCPMSGGAGHVTLYLSSLRWTGRQTQRSRASTWSVSLSTKRSSVWTARRWSPPVWGTRCSTCTTWWRAGSHLSTLSEVRGRATHSFFNPFRIKVWQLLLFVALGLNENRVKEFSVCPDGGALLLTGTRGYLHLLTLKVGDVHLHPLQSHLSFNKQLTSDLYILILTSCDVICWSID